MKPFKTQQANGSCLIAINVLKSVPSVSAVWAQTGNETFVRRPLGNFLDFP